MSYDIYGNPLMPGHCERHPHVHEEYPCSVCRSERLRSQARAVTHWAACWRSGPEHYECARAEVERLREAEAELHEIASVLPGVAYMDPPDGGSPSLLEQFRRMRADLDRTAAERDALRADAKRYQWLRDNRLHPVSHPNGDAWGMSEVIYGDDLDAAIDAVIRARGES